MDFLNHIKTLKEEREYKKKPNIGGLVKREMEKSSEIPYEYAGILKKFGFKGSVYLYVLKLNNFLLSVYKKDGDITIELKAYNTLEETVTLLSVDELSGDFSEWIKGKVELAKKIDSEVNKF